MDIYETGNALVVKADLPDVCEKDLDVRIENKTLTIRGERKFEKKVEEENYLRVERAYGSFSRSFSLPNTVNSEAIRAEYKNSVLTVELPKRAESKPKQIKVNVTSRPQLIPVPRGGLVASAFRPRSFLYPGKVRDFEHAAI